MRETITARRLISTESSVVERPLMILDSGHIHSIESLSEREFARIDATHHFPDAILVPSYIDIHIHGAAGHDVMEATSEALNVIGSSLSRRGVGAYFPTTVTSTRERTLMSLSGLAREIQRFEQSNDYAAAIPLGVHLEGPFLSPHKPGVHAPELLEAPSIPLFERFWQASEGHIRLMTIAPEVPGDLELIAYATKKGVCCSAGHSNATAREAKAGLSAGILSATHMFNAMRAIDHRDPGIAAFVLDEPSLYAEMIADGIHVDPMMVRLCAKTKGTARIVLVTDGIGATGMPEGIYQLGEIEVMVREGRCTSNGTLAGSVLTLDRAVQNFMEFTQTDLITAVLAASRNPAQLMGVENHWGKLEVGSVANFAVLSPCAEVVQSFLSGRPTIPPGAGAGTGFEIFSMDV